jgi:hypothetical protein
MQLTSGWAADALHPVFEAPAVHDFARGLTSPRPLVGRCGKGSRAGEGSLGQLPDQQALALHLGQAEPDRSGLPRPPLRPGPRLRREQAAVCASGALFGIRAFE